MTIDHSAPTTQLQVLYLPPYNSHATQPQRFEKIIVLRNRRRTLVFVESPLDSFGPASGVAADLDPVKTERRAGVGDLDPMAPAWQPPDKVMKELKNERPQLDDAIMGMMVGR